MKILYNYFLTVLLVFSIISCETDVPDIDTISPAFSFQITGDGFNRTFSQDDDLDNIQLNLKAGVSYSFILGGIDNGGVRNIQFQHTSDYTPITTSIPSPWVVNNNGLTSTIQFTGDITNAFTAQLLPGSFTATLTDEGIVSDSFYIRVEDFGGENGPPFNITEGILQILIGNHDTEVVLL